MRELSNKDILNVSGASLTSLIQDFSKPEWLFSRREH